ncbi:MAG: GNAT family protein [Anaerolineae bacterium]|jgi:GNAT superfamily N-acetyltransferase
MDLVFQPMDRSSARAIVTWRYPAPYSCYDLGGEDAEETIAFLVDPTNDYYAITEPLGKLVAYCCFGADARVPGGNYDAAALDIGLGVEPGLTGQGQGLRFVEACMAFARQSHPATMWRVTVARFNRRARRVWQKAGFRERGSFLRSSDGQPFVILVREV